MITRRPRHDDDAHQQHNRLNHTSLATTIKERSAYHDNLRPGLRPSDLPPDPEALCEHIQQVIVDAVVVSNTEAYNHEGGSNNAAQRVHPEQRHDAAERQANQQTTERHNTPPNERRPTSRLTADQHTDQQTNREAQRLHTLITQRQQTPNDDHDTRKQLSKCIQKEIRTQKRRKRRAHIGGVLEKFRNLKSIARIKTRRRRTLITHMTDKEGSKRTTRQEIADVFAEFYEQLYSSTAEPTLQEGPATDHHRPAAPQAAPAPTDQQHPPANADHHRPA